MKTKPTGTLMGTVTLAKRESLKLTKFQRISRWTLGTRTTFQTEVFNNDQSIFNDTTDPFWSVEDAESYFQKIIDSLIRSGYRLDPKQVEGNPGPLNHTITTQG